VANSTDNPPPEPPKYLVSSDRVRLLTSWKPWLLMLGLAIAGIGAVFIVPAVKRSQALDFIESHGGSYQFVSNTNTIPAWWLSLTRGFRHVESIDMRGERLTPHSLRMLSHLSEAKLLRIFIEGRVESAGIPEITNFFQLDKLSLSRMDVTPRGLATLLSQAPTLREIEVHRVVGHNSWGDVVNCPPLLEDLHIHECAGELALGQCPRLESLTIERLMQAKLTVHDAPKLYRRIGFVDVEDSSIDLNCSPAVRGVYFGRVAGLFEFSVSHRLDTVYIKHVELSHDWDGPPIELKVPACTGRLQIELLEGACSLVGGAPIEELTIGRGFGDLAVEKFPELRSLALHWNDWKPATLSLIDLPKFEHLMMQTSPRHSADGPKLNLHNLPNLRAIDAPYWHEADDVQIARICRLPRLEHLNVMNGQFSPEIISRLRNVETLRLLRLPRQWSRWRDGVWSICWLDWKEVDFQSLRGQFSQPEIAIHGPFRSSEVIEFWSGE
jgi:hypothetical protein